MQAEITLRQAAQQALEALERYRIETPLGHQPHMIAEQADSAITALKQALSEPEPLGWITAGQHTAPLRTHWEGCEAVHPECRRPEQNPFGDDAERYARKLHEEREYYKALFTERKPQTTHWEGCEAVHPECRKQEPMATKQMLRWVEHLKRLSDDGQHMSIPGLSSGACWELAIELEQFIKNTAPTPRKPVELTDAEILDANYPDGEEADPIIAAPDSELIAFSRAVMAVQRDREGKPIAHWRGVIAPQKDAAELRRLHAELERKSDAIQRLWKERDELRALNAELVEALRCADAMLSGANMDAKAVERKVAAALAKVEASK